MSRIADLKEDRGDSGHGPAARATAPPPEQQGYAVNNGNARNQLRLTQLPPGLMNVPS